MARFQTTPRYPLGTRVLKRFPGYAEPFAGKVDGFMPASGFYHITYDDGDSEEMTEDDVEMHFNGKPRQGRKLASLPQRPVPSAAKQLTLNLSASSTVEPKKKKESPHAATPRLDEDYAMADVEDEEADGEDEGGDLVEEITSADEIYKLVGQRVCKKQAQNDGRDAIVIGTVSTYFPATKMYRVVYSNGTTDDMTYREAVDSIALSSHGLPPTKKRKVGDGESPDHASPRTSSIVSSKKQKGDDISSKKEQPMTDENPNTEKSSQVTGDGAADIGSAMEMPTLDEQSFVWNRKSAYDTVRTVLYVVVSTTSKNVDSLKALEQKDLKGRQALEMFVKNGGLTALEERLTTWSKEKETEAGVLAILKVLAVIPGVTSDAIVESKIGKTLNNIKKGRVHPGYSRIVSDLASWVIKKWKKNIFEGGDQVKTEKKVEIKSAPKPLTTTNNGEPPSTANGSSVFLKRSNSAGHLRDLISGPRRNQRNGDFLGSALNGRTVVRKLGAQRAHMARRSTVLLDSIASRVLKNDADKAGSPSGTKPVISSDAWTASRVKFGEHSTLLFDNEIEVSLLLIAPTRGAIRPFKPKSSEPKIPAPDKQPTKSILRVKLDSVERDAIAASVKAEGNLRRPAETDQINIGSSSVTESFPIKSEPISEGDEGRNSVCEEEDTGEKEDTSTLRVIAPPSPPRKHDASEDEDDGDADDLPPMPHDLLILAESPTLSDVALVGSSGGRDGSPPSGDDNMEIDNQNSPPQSGGHQVESPQVSDSPASVESGEIVDGDVEQPSPSPRSKSSPSPPSGNAPSAA